MTRAARVAAALAIALAAGCASPIDPAVVDAARRDLDALAARSAPDADPGTVDVLLAPDEAYLGRLGRDAIPSLVRAVEALDRVLGPEVGLRFRVGGAARFSPTPDSEDLRRILWEARLGLRRGGCDVVAAFTGQRCGDRAGTAEPRLRLLLCADASDPERNLLHEAAHLFGAQDYPYGHPGYATPTPMSYDSDQPRTLAFDPANLARIRARRGALPPAAPDAVAAALEARCAALPGTLGRDLREAFLCAESWTMHAEGVEAAKRVLAASPDDLIGCWSHAENLRALGRGVEAWPRVFESLRFAEVAWQPARAAGPAHDALDRHVLLDVARLAVDRVDHLDEFDRDLERHLASLGAAFPGDAEILDLRASFRTRAKDREAAEPLYRAAAAAAPGETYPWRHLAVLARGDGDPDLWLEAWHGAFAADPLDPLLAIRWIEEGLHEYPTLVRSDDLRRQVDAALEAAEAAFPEWTRPAELRHEMRTRRP